MKKIYTLIVICLFACNDNIDRTKSIKQPNIQEQVNDTVEKADIENSEGASSEKSYSNERFRNVTVEKTGAHTFSIQGEAQIFEANFGWIIEDGHNELKKGFEMTDAGAPEWGKFKFSVTAEKQRPNSTLMLVLFETSAKDGSRQHELVIELE